MRLWNKLRLRLAPDHNVPAMTDDLLGALLPALRRREDLILQDMVTQLHERRLALKRTQFLPAAEVVELLRQPVVVSALVEIADEHHVLKVRLEASAIVAAVAAQAGLTAEQLADSIVPFCDLHDRSLFDYGPRQFELVLGNNHTPLLRDGPQRMHTGLPHPRSTDIHALVAEAGVRWRIGKRQLAYESRLQTRRFQRAMINGRRWTPTEFRASVLEHPLLGELARRLIWAGLDAVGTWQEAFSVADQLSPVGESYTSIDLDQFAAIGLPHPVHATPERRLRWNELLSDFHVAPLFLQAARPVYSLSATELERTAITRFQNIPLQWGALGRLLQGSSWMFVNPYEAESTYAFRPFPGAGVIATIFLASDNNSQYVKRCIFISDKLPNPHMLKELPALPLLSVDPVAVSEVLWQLTQLTSEPKLLL